MAAERDVTAAPLSPAEFCALQRGLVERMAMRKKRRVNMEPVQRLKLGLLAEVEREGPVASGFEAALARAVLAVSGEGEGTGPAQAVASDLLMDWHLSAASPGFVAWLRQVGAPEEPPPPRPSPKE